LICKTFLAAAMPDAQMPRKIVDRKCSFYAFVVQPMSLKSATIGNNGDEWLKTHDGRALSGSHPTYRFYDKYNSTREGCYCIYGGDGGITAASPLTGLALQASRRPHSGRLRPSAARTFTGRSRLRRCPLGVRIPYDHISNIKRIP